MSISARIRAVAAAGGPAAAAPPGSDQGDPGPPLGSLDQRDHRRLPRWSRSSTRSSRAPTSTGRRSGDYMFKPLTLRGSGAHHRADLRRHGRRRRRRRRSWPSCGSRRTRCSRGSPGCYIWFFRGTPVYVQIILWGNIGVLYDKFYVGLPFTGLVFGSTDSGHAGQQPHRGRHPGPGPERGGVRGRAGARRHHLRRRRPDRGRARRSACRRCSPCAASCCRRRCASSSRRWATRRSACSRRRRCSPSSAAASRCSAACRASTRRRSRSSRCSSWPRPGTSIVTSILTVGQARLEAYFGKGFGDEGDRGGGEARRQAHAAGQPRPRDEVLAR